MGLDGKRSDLMRSNRSIRLTTSMTPSRMLTGGSALLQALRDFDERGFDRVKVDEIAEAADVSRMTVFNHFPRKEDMFFDLDDKGHEELLASLQKRKAGTQPVEALRLFAHWAVANQRPYVRFFDEGSDKFMATLQESEALKARARAIGEELTDTLTVALAKTMKRQLPDRFAGLAASLLVATWAVALVEAHRLFQQDHDLEKGILLFWISLTGERKGSVLPWKEHRTTKTADHSKSSRAAASMWLALHC